MPASRSACPTHGTPRPSERSASPSSTGRVIRPDDDGRTVEALLWLLRSRIRFLRRTRHHIKIGPINFFPTTGKITIDGAGPALPQKGLAALQELLRSGSSGEASSTVAPRADDPACAEPASPTPSPPVDPAAIAAAGGGTASERQLLTPDVRPPWED